MVPTIKSYIKDTTYFVKFIRDAAKTPAETLLVTFDVISLYTNIPNQEGMKACAKALSRQLSNTSKPSTSKLIQLMGLVLVLNNFVFNDKHYIQTGGTALGTQLAPSYANLLWLT